ncbi:MAG: VWA domain-containing protein [Armatimonadetes bacterium]|nr:VWA domain-containing protein [Armatimonadota bacterium]
MNRQTRFLSTGIILAALCAMSVPALADGFMVPVHQPTVNVFSVKYHHVDIFIDGQAATTKVDQVFHNETGRQEEGTYIFPLPKGAAIHKFSMFVGEKEHEGKILDRDEARRLYESIVRQRKDPALLEYMDRNTFRARVFPIPPNGDTRIRLEYTEVIPKTGSICRYVYPLSTEKFSARPLDDVRVTIRLKSATPISNIYSPSHIVKVEQTVPKEAIVNWTAKNVKPDTDLVLYYSQAAGEMAVDVLTFRENGKQGYFMLLASPKITESKVIPKNVVFVLDRTGSMAGDKIDQAKAALKYCLNSLKPEDQFNVISFNESQETLFAELEKPTKERLRKALDTVDRIDATGGTNINDALRAAFAQFRQYGQTQNYVVFLTDGLPTVGEQNIEKILGNAKEVNGSKARVFGFGVGYDVNAHLLDLLGEQSGGKSSYVLPNENIEASVSTFFAGISQPALTDIEITAKTASGEVAAYDMLPGNPIPALFNGSQLIVLGRYNASGTAFIKLTGKTADGLKTWTARVNLPEKDTERDFIPQIWAARKIGYLLDQVRLHRNDELIQEIVRLSKEWGIPTEFTSYFVDEPQIAMEDAFRRSEEAIGSARKAESGSWGVSQSINSGSLRNQNQVWANPGAVSADERMGNVRGYYGASGGAVNVSRVQNIGTRTFYQRGVQWVDNLAADPGLKAVQIKQFSNAHFKLLAASPDLARYQSLGNVRVFVNNQAVEIGDQGREDLTDAEVRLIVGGNPSSGALPSRNPLEATVGAAGLGLLLAAGKLRGLLGA